MRSVFFILLLALLHGCATTARAPVASRHAEPEPAPTVSRPGGQVITSPTTPVTRPASPVSRPLARPAGTEARPVARQAGLYTVRRGDTMYSIAWQHGLAVSELARLNGIRSPYTIYPGQRLRTSGSLQTVAPPQTTTGPVPKPAVARPPAAPAAQPDAAREAAKPVQQATTAGDKGPVFDGTWVWPTRGRILRSFKENVAGKQGIDIGGHHAQPVKAAAGGKVVYAGSGLVGYGRLIIVKHNENLLSAYGHNSKLLVAEGDRVKAGEVIAKMGNSGTDRTALYFEIRKHGKPVNPLHYLPRN